MQSWGIKCTTRGAVFAPHSTSPFQGLHLPFTLFCTCCFTHSAKKQLCCLPVTLECLNQFFHQSSVLFLCILSPYTKIAKYLILPISQFHFFFQFVFFFFINSPESWQLKSICNLCLYFPQHSFFHSPSWQLRALLAPVSVVDIPSGCWLDRPVTTLLARETYINISPLCCPYSSVEGHDGVGDEGGGWAAEWGGEKERKERKVKRRKKS